MNFKLVGLVAVCGVAVIACGDDTTGTGGSGGSGGETTTTGTTTGVTSTTTTGAGGMDVIPVCYDGGAALALNPTNVPNATVGQNVCDATQIADLLTECFDPGTMVTCDAYLAANPTCFTCLLGSDMPPFPLPVLLGSDMATYVSLYGCQAMAMNLPQCAVPVQNLVFCGYTACESCASGDEDNECINYAINDPDVCGQIVLDPACEAVFAAATLDPKCDGADFDTLYTNIATYFCGPAL